MIVTVWLDAPSHSFTRCWQIDVNAVGYENQDSVGLACPQTEVAHPLSHEHFHSCDALIAEQVLETTRLVEFVP